MSCFRPKTPKTLTQENQETKNVIHEVLLSVPGCKVHLMEEGEAVELDTGDFTLFRVSDDSAVLATTVKVGDLQWPLTKDEPVVKLDALHYLFSLPVKDGEPFSYGVTFLGGGNLGLLDSFLNEHSCFSCSSSSASSSNRNKDVNWKEYAPAIQNYNNFLAKAIAGGTGQIVKGIFKCSNAYTNQVQKGGEMILTQAAEQKTLARERSNRNAGTTKKSGLNKSLKRVRKISKMTEKMSKKMLDGVGIATGSIMAPVVRSQSGKAFLAMVPGEVLLASLDAVSLEKARGRQQKMCWQLQDTVPALFGIYSRFEKPSIQLHLFLQEL
ncbi:senescence/dehydration-associated protein At4g35985, chloroplastic-like isoform X3 [Camellia sinensis]|uniref:senescence/dehydration-associated protein At4g35985, chloroplastic-like isoform X3 n=1 Tax=Camellia sinensis TaxID=4442 RepID=UPI0010358A55|nr:senescence/dehydration-associated protein At4g35985, chloroplastic-like isoform X3 [Camellia sinensis]